MSNLSTTSTVTAPPDSLGSKLNWLRAGVLGANDGITSTAGIVMGVAGATKDTTALLIAGLAGLVAGALSMAGGEYVSVSSQKDTELATVATVQANLKGQPEVCTAFVKDSYVAQGFSAELADEVTQHLMDNDPVAAVTRARYGIDSNEQTSPVQAAFASFVAFTAGALIPLTAMVATPSVARVIVTLVAVVIALTLTGYISAKLSGASRIKSVLRNVIVGVVAMGLTYAVGHVVGVNLT